MKVIIDRFEGESAVVELPDGSFSALARALVPEASEGDVVRIEIDVAETQTRKKRISGLMKELWAD